MDSDGDAEPDGSESRAKFLSRAKHKQALLIARIEEMRNLLNDSFRWHYGRIIFSNLSLASFVLCLVKDFLKSLIVYGYRHMSTAVVVRMLLGSDKKNH